MHLQRQSDWEAFHLNDEYLRLWQAFWVDIVRKATVLKNALRNAAFRGDTVYICRRPLHFHDLLSPMVVSLLVRIIWWLITWQTTFINGWCFVQIMRWLRTFFSGKYPEAILVGKCFYFENIPRETGWESDMDTFWLPVCDDCLFSIFHFSIIVTYERLVAGPQSTKK